MDWQCRPCNYLEKDVDVKNLVGKIEMNMIDGEAETPPACSKCHKIMRPNINMRDDLDWMEGESAKEMKRMQEYFESPAIHKRSITVIEIGAGPAQPLARKLADMFLNNDKYRCAVIRINPVLERLSQYKDEQNYFKDLIKRQRQQDRVNDTNSPRLKAD